MTGLSSILTGTEDDREYQFHEEQRALLVKAMKGRDRTELEAIFRSWKYSSAYELQNPLGYAIGAGNVWAADALLSMGAEIRRDTSIGFGIFLSAQEGERRDGQWKVWALLLERWQESPVVALRGLASNKTWHPGDAEKTGLREKMKEAWQVPTQNPYFGPVTPLQQAWQYEQAGFCRLLIELGASPIAQVPDSCWPAWSLKRFLDGESILSGTESPEATKAADQVLERFRFSGEGKSPGSTWHGLRAWVRQWELDQDLPKPSSRAGSPRF